LDPWIQRKRQFNTSTACESLGSMDPKQLAEPLNF
jgi:hypothetical protein